MIPKFKAKSIAKKNNGEWVYGTPVEDDSGEAYMFDGVVDGTNENIVINYWCRVAKETICMSTGITDENEQEIFEGDIVETVRTEFSEADEVLEKNYKGIVRQLEGSWFIDTDKELVALFSEIDTNKLVGNVWEN